MAVTFNLSDGTTTIDFTSATDFVLKSQLGEGFLPKVAVPTGDNGIPAYITEVVPVFIRCTSHNDMATTLQEFHSLQRRAAEYWVDEQQYTPVWWNIKTDDETGARRALVRSLALDFAPDWGGIYNDCPDLDAGRPANVVIVRHPYWERSSALSTATGSSLSVFGGLFDYSGTDVVGDVGARINKMTLDADDTFGIMQFFMGFRSTLRHPSAANFVGKWECEAGGNGVDASDAVDATASGGNVVEVDFAGDASNALRLTMPVSTYTANEEDNYGRMMMLLAMEVDAGTTAEVYIEQGQLLGQADTFYGRKVQVTESSAYYYNMGIFTFPFRNLQAVTTTHQSENLDSTDTLYIYAARTGGAGSLYLDCLCLVPVDEYFVFIDRIYCTLSPDNDYVMGVSPNDIPCGVTYLDAATDTFVAHSPIAQIGNGVPIGDGRAVCVVAGTDGKRPTNGDTFDVTMDLVPRWVTLRGSE